ncbi:ATP-binding protein [Dactylosporangium sp. CA-233914]|uniref:sensor histidine kinase n=1 Tax=Dactylosporangium sp. CA-233914 TaxID=3239934 RepID=UPI003D8B52DB
MELDRPARSAVAVPLGLLVLQALWWPLVPWWSGQEVPQARLLPVAVVCAVVGGALAYRQRAPEAVLAATVVVTALGWSVAADAPAGPAAVAVALYSLSVRRTAGVAVVGALAVAVAAGVVAAARGGSVRDAAGVALVVGAVAAGVWAVGRRRRRGLADRRAAAAARTAAATLPAFAAAAERRRLAADLHDVVAHRLTGVVVSVAAARRLADRRLQAEALAHAEVAGGQALAELDDIAAAQVADPTLEDVRRLCAERPGTVLRCTVADVPAPVAALAHRVVREALTNAARYAAGARLEVEIDEGVGDVRVVVDDDGGAAASRDVGTGQGLTGLRALVEAAGGRFDAGPRAGGGWRVRAELPLPKDAAAGGWPAHRGGAAARDRAMAVLAFGLSAGLVLLPGPDDMDLLARPGPAGALLVLLVLHALPLAGRRLAPAAALAAACVVSAALTGCTSAGWIPLDPAEAFLWTWWVEVALVYAVGAHRAGRGWPAPLAVAALGGAALAAGHGITGPRPAAAAVLAAILAVLLGPVWAAGRLARVRRLRQDRRAEERRRDTAVAADSAAHHERRRIVSGLQVRVRRHVVAVLEARRRGDLEAVHREARDGLHALRHLVTVEEPPEPPPGLLGIRAVAAARRSTVRVLGEPHHLPDSVALTAQEAVAALLADGSAVTMSYLPDALEVTVRRPPAGDRGRRSVLMRAAGADGGVARARRLVDAGGGAVSVDGQGGTVRVWLPLTLR